MKEQIGIPISEIVGILLISLLLWMPGILKPALSANDPPTQPKTYIMKLENHPTDQGVRLTGAYGQVNQKGHHFLIENLSIFEPVDIGVLIDDPSQPVVLELHKYRFEDPLMTERTDEKGTLFTRIRTQGDLRIRVRAVNDAVVPYKLVIRIGKPIEPEPLEAFIQIKHGSSTGKASKMGALKIPFIIGGILAILIVIGSITLFLIIFFYKKNQKL